MQNLLIDFKIYALIYREPGAVAVDHRRFSGDFAKYRLKMALGGKVQQSGDLPQTLVCKLEQAPGLRDFFLLDIPGQRNPGLLLEAGTQIGSGIAQGVRHLLGPDAGEQVFRHILGAHAEKAALPAHWAVQLSVSI